MLLEDVIMKFTLQVDNDNANRDAMLNALTSEINEHMRGIDNNITALIRPLVTEAIMSCYEMNSLLGGSLQGHLGLRPGDNDYAVFAITQAVSNATYATWTPVQNKKPGRLEILVQPDNFANLLSLRAGVNVATHKTDGEYEMEWLDWLLTLGDTPIVKGFEYQRDPTGRSGIGIMKKKDGVSWRVPPEFAGTLDDNFVTRALDQPFIEREITTILKKILI